MKELKVRINGSEVLFAPIDERLLNIDPDIAAWPGGLLQQQPCNSSAAAAKVEHRVISRQGKVIWRIQRCTVWIIEHGRISRTDQPAHFERRHWYAQARHAPSSWSLLDLRRRPTQRRSSTEGGRRPVTRRLLSTAVAASGMPAA